MRNPTDTEASRRSSGCDGKRQRFERGEKQTGETLGNIKPEQMNPESKRQGKRDGEG